MNDLKYARFYKLGHDITGKIGNENQPTLFDSTYPIRYPKYSKQIG